jgi:hypothetical protein
MSELSSVYALAGRVDESEKIMDEMIIRSKTEFIPGYSLAVIAYSIKDYDSAYKFLEQAVSLRDGTLISMKSWFMSSFIRTDPRFQPFLKRLNFPA